MSQKTKKDLTKELAQELDIFDKMITSLVELLEDKGVLTQKEWEEKIKAKIEKKKNLKSFRDM